MSMSDTAIDTTVKVKYKVPSKYKVILLNDDYTPMEFVIKILQELFNKSFDEAYHLTMIIHEQNRGVCGIYTKEVAEQKTQDVIKVSTVNGHPLKAVFEEV